MAFYRKSILLNYYSRTFLKTPILKNKPNLPFLKNVHGSVCYCSGQSPKLKKVPLENRFSHEILENLSAYNMMIFNPSKVQVLPADIETVIDKTDSSLFEMSIQDLCSLLDSKIRCNDSCSKNIYEIFDAIEKRCHEMNEDQLASVLRNLKYSSVFYSEKWDRLLKLWKEMDKVCLNKWNTWPLDTVFYFIDLWYALELARKSDFVYRSTLKFVRKPKRLSPQHVVQLLFYLNVLRNTCNQVNIFDLEFQLEESIEKISLEEIGIAVMGFFKTETSIHSTKILNHIIDRTIAEIKTIPEITLACILKALRSNITINLWPRIIELLDAVEPELERFSILCSVHASLLTTKGLVLHEGVLSKVSQKLVDSINTCRLKDMEKAVLPLSQLNFNPKTTPCIYQSILNELTGEERMEEIKRYPKTFIALVHYLCLKGIYPEELIKKILHMEFIYHTYGKYKYMFGREVLFIDTVVELEYPSYVGPRLPTELRNYLSKRYSEYLPNPMRKNNKHQTLHLEIKDTAEILFGKEYIIEKYLLPNHPRADIVVHLNKGQHPLSLDSDFKERKIFTGPIKAPIERNYFSLVVGSKNMFLFQTNIPNGETISKLKQLRLLGYTPILVSFDNWPKSTSEKINHLRTLLLNASISDE